MLKVTGGVAAALAMGATAAVAGGIERSSQSTAILFEEGNYLELSYGYVSPSVSGTDGTSNSGDMSSDYGLPSMGLKYALSDNVDLAIIIDSPIGADVAYPLGTGYSYAGSTAEIESTGVTALAKYKLPNNISVFGGLRALQTSGTVNVSADLSVVPGPLPLTLAYTLDTNSPVDFGYVLGAAWEMPEIAARVALTYNSAITTTFKPVEDGVALAPFSSEIPQSVNLEFQTGIMADTLLFGSVRWVDWSVFDITPNAFPGGSLVDYTNDVITYNIGVGRRFNENWSGAIFAGYEETQGGFSGNLGPTDGFTSLGLAATYTRGNMELTAGARYIWIGDAITESPSPLGAGATYGSFSGNSGVAAGIKVAFNF